MRRESFAVWWYETGENGDEREMGERMAARRQVMDKRGISAGYA